MLRILTIAACAFTAGTQAIAAGDLARGKALYESRCIACHSLDENRVGPAHKNLLGRKAGSLPDYDYSEALKRSTVLWNGETLNLWLANPEQFIPGQRMNYSVPERNDRADIILYLKSESGQGR